MRGFEWRGIVHMINGRRYWSLDSRSTIQGVPGRTRESLFMPPLFILCVPPVRLGEGMIDLIPCIGHLRYFMELGHLW